MDAQRQKYIKSIAADCIAVCKGTGLFPSLMIAQACLESRNGLSELSRIHFNHFGIKTSAAWHGAIITYSTTEYVNSRPVKIPQAFRSYPDRKAGFLDRVHFLQNNRRYELAGVFKCTSPEGQAEMLRKAGYATDPNYPTLLKGIINTYNLKQYDI